MMVRVWIWKLAKKLRPVLEVEVEVDLVWAKLSTPINAFAVLDSLAVFVRLVRGTDHIDSSSIFILFLL